MYSPIGFEREALGPLFFIPGCIFPCAGICLSWGGGIVPEIICFFKAGKIYVQEPRRFSVPIKVRVLGNGWRGLLLVGGAILWVYGLRELGLIALSLAVLWSLVAGITKKWRRIFKHQRVLLLLRRGQVQQALALSGEMEPGSLIWWRYLHLLFREQRWSEAVGVLTGTEAGLVKDCGYFLAVAHLGGHKPNQALALCPLRPEGQWRILKAEALFQLQEWQKVLNVLRGRERSGKSRDLEHTWLKGGSYYYLKQYKPALKLFRRLAESGDEAYRHVELWLKDALTKLE